MTVKKILSKPKEKGGLNLKTVDELVKMSYGGSGYDPRADYDRIKRDFDKLITKMHKQKIRNDYRLKFGTRPKYHQDPDEIKDKFNTFAGQCNKIRTENQV